MSKNDALENKSLELILAETTHARIRHIISGNAESGADLVYSTAATITVDPATELEVDGDELRTVGEMQTATGPTALETITRRVLELSMDGGSTYPYWFYSKDLADGDDTAVTGVQVAANTIITVPDGTGFVVTED